MCLRWCFSEEFGHSVFKVEYLTASVLYLVFALSTWSHDACCSPRRPESCLPACAPLHCRGCVSVSLPSVLTARPCLHVHDPRTKELHRGTHLRFIPHSWFTSSSVSWLHLLTFSFNRQFTVLEREHCTWGGNIDY